MPLAFVTGATGFVGGAVLRQLLAEGWSVRALVRPGADTRNLEAASGDGALPAAVSQRELERVERVAGDLRAPDSLAEGLEGCDALFHVAARYTLWNPRPEEIYRDNVEGTRNVLEAARRRGIPRVVHTSTVGTIFLPADGRPGEESRLADLVSLRGHYKRSKWLAEQEARRAAAAGLSVVIVHPSAPVGPGDLKPTPTGQMVVDFLRGRIRAYTETGLNLVAVEDVAKGHLLAAARGRAGESYILGGEDLSLIDILRLLADLADLPAPRLRIPRSALAPIAVASELLSFVVRRPPRVPREAAAMAWKRMYFDSTKARRELGYAPGPIRAALARAVHWYFERGYAAPRRPEVLERLRSEIVLPGVSTHAAL